MTRADLVRHQLFPPRDASERFKALLDKAGHQLASGRLTLTTGDER